MATVALIGPDGAGKTTICQMLERSDAFPIRYLYMGVSVGSSNVALPTTRLADRLKKRNGQLRKRFPRLRAVARLVKRLSEEWYRQFHSWRYELQGQVVVYDRHFLFDFTGPDVRERNRTRSKRLHVWLLEHAYPRPDLTIFLDAPGQVLYERKGELSPEKLERRRQAHLDQVRRFPSVVRVDATQSPEKVLAEVVALLRTRLPIRLAKSGLSQEEKRK